MAETLEEPRPTLSSAEAVGDDSGQFSRRDVGAAEARHRQSLFLSVAVVFVAMIPVEAYIIDRIDPWLLVVQILWPAVFVAAAAMTRRFGAAVAETLDFSLATICSVFFVLEVFLTGGARSPLLPWALVMPVAVSLVARRRIRDSVVSSLICGLSSMAFVWHGHADRRTLVAWGLLAFISGFISIASSLLHARVSATVGTLGRARHKLLQRRAETNRERAEARRLALVGQLAAGVAHEVNNPLSVVKANLNFARGELNSRSHEPWSKTILESLEEAAGGVERIRLLVRDLGELAPQSRFATAAEECEPEELLADAVDTIRAGTSVSIVTEADADLSTVRVVRHHVVQVLRSLLHNAVDSVESLPEGRLRRVVARASESPGAIQFDVEDTGSGFSESVLSRLFEPFFTTKPFGGGKGLSLAKSREHVLRAGGSITAENLPYGGGARFTVRLPSHRPVQAPS
jgi:signal transduction histidine kinase